MNKRLALECGVLTGAAIFALLALPLPELPNNLRGANKDSVREAEHRKRPDAIFEEHGIRPVYPHSLIRGGVKNVEDFKRAINKDDVLAHWFAGFDFESAKPCTMPNGLYYVTIRTEQGITWSRKPIGKGAEPCITDGRRTLLVKCGNEVSFIPQEPSQEITSEEIAEPVWEQVKSPALVGEKPEAILTHPTNGSQLPSVPYPPTLGIPVPPVVILPLPPPTIKVPEPSSLGLSTVGIFIFGFAAWLNKRMRMR